MFSRVSGLSLGLVSVLLVFPDAMDLFLGSVSFVLLVLLQTENLFSDLVGVLFTLSMFLHNSHLFLGLVGMSFINVSTHILQLGIVGVSVNYVFYSYLLCCV